MKSCLGVLILATMLVVILGVGGVILYASQTTEFTRKDQGSGSSEDR